MEPLFVKGQCYCDGTEENLRISEWKSLHLIFIFLNDGEMPIIYASCIAKMKEKKEHCCVCFLNIQYIMDVFYLHLEKKKKLHNLVNRKTY